MFRENSHTFDNVMRSPWFVAVDGVDREAEFFACFFHINAPFISTYKRLKSTYKNHLERNTLLKNQYSIFYDPQTYLTTRNYELISQGFI